MLPIEILVRIEPGAGSAFGSGILIGREHVLTCAHVVDPDYSRADYADDDADSDAPANINDRPIHNERLRDRMARRYVEAVAYDGIPRQAHVIAVHAHEDLVLLKLSTPVSHTICLPELQKDYEATTTSTASGLGFRRTRPSAFSIHSENLTLTSSDSARFETRSSSFQGQANEGMSGGPVLMEFADGKPKIIAMLTMGGSTQATCGVVRADTLFKFLASRLGEGTLAPQADASHGLSPVMKVPLGKASWLPLPKMRRDGDSYGYDRMRFIASRPLTFADIDAVTGYNVKKENKPNRECFFAPMTIDEAREVVQRFTGALGETLSIPDRKAQESLKPPSDIPIAEGRPSQAADHAWPELLRAPECDSRRCRLKDGAVFPAGYAPEWVLDDGKPRLAFSEPGQSNWEIAALQGALAEKRYKALLRPVLTIPVWASAQ